MENNPKHEMTRIDIATKLIETTNNFDFMVIGIVHFSIYNHRRLIYTEIQICKFICFKKPISFKLKLKQVSIERIETVNKGVTTSHKLSTLTELIRMLWDRMMLSVPKVKDFASFI